MSARTTQTVVVSKAALDPGTATARVALFKADGTPLLVTDTGATVVLTGFVTGSAVTAVSATDTVNAAIAKLQNRIAVLEAA